MITVIFRSRFYAEYQVQVGELLRDAALRSA